MPHRRRAPRHAAGLGSPPRPDDAAGPTAGRELHVARAVPTTTQRFTDAPIRPRDWYFDWSRRLPLADPAVAHWLGTKLAGVILPPGWIDAPTAALADAASPAAAVWECDAEHAALSAAFLDLIGGARAQSTLQHHRAPFLKLTLYLALRARPVAPPRGEDVRLYLTALTVKRRNASAPQDALRALQFVCHLNKWPSISQDPHCRLALQGAARAFSAPTKKAPPIEAYMVVAIVRGMCGEGQPPHERMLGWAILACYMCVCRYDDLTHLRWEEVPRGSPASFEGGYFEDKGSHLRFFLENRKSSPPATRTTQGTSTASPPSPSCARRAR